MGTAKERPPFPLPPPILSSAHRSRFRGGVLWGRDGRGRRMPSRRAERRRRRVRGEGAGRWLTSAAIAAAGFLACGRSLLLSRWVAVAGKARESWGSSCSLRWVAVAGKAAGLSSTWRRRRRGQSGVGLGGGGGRGGGGVGREEENGSTPLGSGGARCV